jgi:low affinity Fe/Cu permease
MGKTDQGRISRLADRVTEASGSPLAFVSAFTIVVLWGLSGPIFGFSETWQLVINTGTTIVTFLMVFAIQHTTNRESRAIHAKLDELIAVTDARDELQRVEQEDERVIEEKRR